VWGAAEIMEAFRLSFFILKLQTFRPVAKKDFVNPM
jgi:hypothetical protein